jgi:triacylglycerol esterase/lipase EstA (alpha/beta hydrolase family)
MQNRTFIANLFKQLFSLLLLTAAASGGTFPVTAQTRRQPSVKKTPATTTIAQKIETKCSSGWSGTITFTETFSDSLSDTEPNQINRNMTSMVTRTHDSTYSGVMAVDGTELAPVAYGRINYKNVSKTRGNVRELGSCGRNQHWFTTNSTSTQTETAQGGGTSNFSINVDEQNGTYSFAFSFPDLPGDETLDSEVTTNGFCQPQNNKTVNENDKSNVTVRGGRARVENQRFDPQNPNSLSGTLTIAPPQNSGELKKTVKTVAWRLRRCSPALVIAGMKFYQPLYPSPDAWVEIGKNDYTIDGNEVKIVATIANLSGAPKSSIVNFRELSENKDLPEAKVQVNLAPHEIKEVEYVWDTSGFAWKEDAPYNTPAVSRSIQATIPDDRVSEMISVNPKPVVIVPGLWSKPEKTGQFVNYFKNQNVPWAVAVAPVYVGQKAKDNALIVDKTVRELQRKENAWHVDLVAHSTGGLAARAYVDHLMPTAFDNRPAALHLVMLGTPNLGTPCTPDDAAAKNFKSETDAFAEISPENMSVFNESVAKKHGTKFIAMIGDSESPTCTLNEPGDGVVPTISARYLSKTYIPTNENYENLGGEQSVFTQVRKWLALPANADFAPEN